VEPPPEGFAISSNTAILCDGTVTETEEFHWTYFEGTGTSRRLLMEATLRDTRSSRRLVFRRALK